MTKLRTSLWWGRSKLKNCENLTDVKVLNSIVMNGTIVTKIAESDNSEIKEEKRHREEEQLHKSIIRDVVRLHRERHAILMMTEKKDECVQRVDDNIDITLSCSAIRQVEERESKHLRDLREFWKVDERDAIARYEISPNCHVVDETQTKLPRGAHVNQVTIRDMTREFESGDRRRCRWKLLLSSHLRLRMRHDQTWMNPSLKKHRARQYGKSHLLNTNQKVWILISMSMVTCASLRSYCWVHNSVFVFLFRFIHFNIRE